MISTNRQRVPERVADALHAQLRSQATAYEFREVVRGNLPQRFRVDEAAVHVPQNCFHTMRLCQAIKHLAIMSAKPSDEGLEFQEGKYVAVLHETTA